MLKDNLNEKNKLKSIIGGSIGNLVEWYDWYAYSAFAVYFSAAFFPQNDEVAQLLNTAGIFALGFFMRPIGGWIFGKIADKQGRKKSMTLSVLLMSFGSMMIAFTPTYATIGILAPFLLLIARMLQGLSVGGEYGVSATYLSEMATNEKRGFYSSFQYVTLIGGQLLALGVQIILQKLLLSEDEIKSWGWRIPFVLGALLSIVALYMRNSLDETSDYKSKANVARETKGSIVELLKHPKAVLTVMGLTMGGTLAFYTYTTYMQKFLVLSVGLSKEQSTLLSFFTLLIFAMIQPVFGNISDRIGRKPLLITFGILGTFCTIFIFRIISNASESLFTIFLMMLFSLIIVSGYTSINAVVKAELFPAEIRALGVGLPYAITVAIFGGSAEYVALWFKSIDREFLFYWYVTICIFISLCVYYYMDDTKHTSFIGKD